MNAMKTGTAVRISGERGCCIGRVVEVSRPELLPELPPYPDGTAPPRVAELQAILDDAQVDEIWWVAYHASPRCQLLIAILHHRDGSTYDLQRQRLAITELLPGPLPN